MYRVGSYNGCRQCGSVKVTRTVTPIEGDAAHELLSVTCAGCGGCRARYKRKVRKARVAP